MLEYASQNSAPLEEPSSEMRPDFLEKLRAEFPSLLDPALYQPDPRRGAALRQDHPYLFEPVLKTGEIHPNSDHRIEDLTDEDMDLPIDFI